MNCYYTKIKLLAIEKIMGINLKILTKGLEQDLINKAPMAKQFYYLIYNRNREKQLDV